MNPQAAQSYLRTRVLTATPEQLQLMLYDGAIRFADQARQSLEKKDYENTYLSISRAQKIVLELTSSLKHGQSPELCGKLASLYNYIYRRLTEASVQHVSEPIDEAIKLLRFQRETWALLLEKLAGEKSPAAAGNDKAKSASPHPALQPALSVQG